jgi:membrane-bound ClpP family serine protease
MASNLVERSPVPLIGLVLVLVGEKNFLIFQFLSKACLVVGVLFLLLLPLFISSTWRIQLTLI